MAQKNPPAEFSQLRLALDEYVVKDGTVSVSAGSCMFACTFGPVIPAVLSALDRAAATHASICLDGPRPIVLCLQSVERRGPQSVRIYGRLLDPTLPASWSGRGSDWG